MCRLNSGYCYEHKIDNLCKENVTALGKGAVQAGYLNTEDSDWNCLHRIQCLSAKSWLHSTHKLRGMPSSRMTLLCKHDKFKSWITKLPWSVCLKNPALLKSLGPLVGVMFWALFKTWRLH
jgi:hypothetical protein